MAIAILANTPVWAWIVLAGLVVLGVAQSRPRRVPRALVFVLPAIMITLSLASLRSSFGLQVDAFTAWAAGVATAAILNDRVFLSPRDVRYDIESGRFELPGSWVPMLLMLAIFSARFVIGVTAAMSPAAASDVSFIRAVSMVLGFLSGMFLARSLRILGVRREARSRATSGV